MTTDNWVSMEAEEKALQEETMHLREVHELAKVVLPSVAFGSDRTFLGDTEAAFELAETFLRVRKKRSDAQLAKIEDFMRRKQIAATVKR